MTSLIHYFSRLAIFFGLCAIPFTAAKQFKDDGQLVYKSRDIGIELEAPSATAATYWVLAPQSPLQNTPFDSISSDSSGQYLSAVASPGAIYASSDYGISWAIQSTGVPPTAKWASIALAAKSSANKRYAAVTNGPIYSTPDGGNTWSKIPGSPTLAWQAVASDDVGGKLVAAATSAIYTYAAAGPNAGWALVSSPAFPTQQQWQSLAASSSASILAVGENGGDIYISTDSGSTWRLSHVPTPSLSPVWISLSMSNNGGILAAIASGDANIYISTSSYLFFCS